MADKQGSIPLETVEKSGSLDIQRGRTISNESRPADKKDDRDDDDASSHSSHSSHSRGSVDMIDAADAENASPEEIARSLSRASSARSRAVTIIPRSERRGWLGRFGITPEVARPIEYKRSTKWIITMTVALAAAAAPMGSAIFFPVLPKIADEFNTTPTITNLSVAMYMLAMAIFPLWWSSYSETLGRRTIYLVSFILFTIASIASAVSTSIGMLVVFRIIAGGAAASVQAVGAGTIADLWEVYERGRAMGIFYLGPLMGPLIAPILAGVLGQKLGWRSTQWALTIYGVIICFLLVCFVPETLHRRTPAAAKTTAIPRIATTDFETGEKQTLEPNTLARVMTKQSTRQSVKEKTSKFAKAMRRFWIEPWKPMLYLRFPAVVIIVYYAAITFGALYVLSVSIQQTFSKPPYNFSTLIIGLLYIPSALGYIIASPFGGKWCDHIMIREAKAAGRYDENGKLIFIPEDRMRENAYIAAAMYPCALVLYGWAAKYGLHWMVAAVANFFFGVGSMVIFSVATTMLTEFMPKRSSSGVALNNLVRNVFAAIGGVVGAPLIEKVGNGWLFTFLGVWCFASGSVVWAMRRYGPGWRVVMQKAMDKEN